MTEFETIAADATAGRLRDVLRQAGLDDPPPHITDGRWAIVTVDADLTETLITELDARGILWGYA